METQYTTSKRTRCKLFLHTFAFIDCCGGTRQQQTTKNFSADLARDPSIKKIYAKDIKSKYLEQFQT
jgi:hypothetical protein